jgi:hypothetical protein
MYATLALSVTFPAKEATMTKDELLALAARATPYS